MKKQIITIITIFTSIFSRANSTDGFETGLKYDPSLSYRSNVRIPLPYNNNKPINHNDALSAFGVLADENSKIISHQENGYINLDCFNCIVNIRNYYDSISNPENDIVRGKNN